MKSEKIHEHDWENGHCKVCGVDEQKQTEPTNHPATVEQVDELTRLAVDIKMILLAVLGLSFGNWVLLILR